MAINSCCFCCRPMNLNPLKYMISPKRVDLLRTKRLVIRASKVESYESSNFVERMERGWLISQQPRPVPCCSCESKGHVECKWCNGTGFFILGDNMLCQVPSRSTTCVICAGKGSGCCSDCKGTGYRAKWMKEPPITK
ncbi:hypothetical protein ACJIZ3_001468 [Penstemon smallii]|uniref:Uncharacterized protein n=1 Tax=Penstemon smallii TaxID=265156 RepID=A0ABD3U503_9LAMI